MKPFTLDIETIPSRLDWVHKEIKESLSPPGNMKKEETIKKWWAEQSELVYRDKLSKTALDTSLAEVVSIAWAFDDEIPKASTSENEREVLVGFWLWAETLPENTVFVTFNGNQFDWPILLHRSLIHGVLPPRFNTPYFFKNVARNSSTNFDILEHWAGWKQHTISMDKLCKLFGLPGKGGMSGADVWPAFLDGRLEDIAAYNEEDVWRTRGLYEKIKPNV